MLIVLLYKIYDRFILFIIIVFQDFVVRSLNIVKTEIQALNASIQHTHLIMDKIYEKLSSNNTTCVDISNDN